MPRKNTRRTDLHDALVSAPRLDIVLALSAEGPSTVGELARILGVKANALYPHLARLEEVGVLRRIDNAGADRTVATYELDEAHPQVAYDSSDPASVRFTCEYTRLVLRRAATETQRSFEGGRVTTSGRHRDAHVAYLKTWLSKSELARANRLINELVDLFSGARPRRGRRLLSLTFALRPSPTAIEGDGEDRSE